MISLGGMSPEGMRGRRRVGSALGASLEEHQLTTLTRTSASASASATGYCLYKRIS